MRLGCGRWTCPEPSSAPGSDSERMEDLMSESYPSDPGESSTEEISQELRDLLADIIGDDDEETSS